VFSFSSLSELIFPRAHSPGKVQIDAPLFPSGYRESDFANYMNGGNQTRINALGDCCDFYIASYKKSCEEIADETHPEVAQAATVRNKKSSGERLQKARELATLMAAPFTTT
jgi:hypothetical protein